MKGKEKCEKLKSIRKMIADKNGIEYTPTICNHKRECKGVCPTCDMETEYILNEINKKIARGQPVDIDIDISEKPNIQDDNDDIQVNNAKFSIDSNERIITDDEYLMGEAEQPRYVLQGDISAPDDYLENLDDEDNL